MHSYDDETHVHVTPEALKEFVGRELEEKQQALMDRVAAAHSTECKACEHDVPLRATTTDELHDTITDATPGKVFVHVDEVDASVWDQPVREDRAARRARARGKKPR